MADSTVSGMTANGGVTNTDLFYADNGTTDTKVTGAQLKTFTSASPTLVTPNLGVATATSVNGTTTPPVATTLGYLGLPQNSQSTAYTTVLNDAGGHILHPTADNNARTFTIAANASVAYPVGTAITFINQINTLTIAINSDTLTLAGAGTTGSRTLAAKGIATAVKVSATEWYISGTGLT